MRKLLPGLRVVCRLIEFQRTQARRMMPGLCAQLRTTDCLALAGRRTTTSPPPPTFFPLPTLDSSPSSWQSAQISLGVLRSIVKFSLLKAWNEIDSNFVFISFPVWLCLCVRVSVLACVCVVITIVTTFGASVMSAKSCTRNYFNLPSWLYQTTIRSKTMQSFRLMWPTNILI